MSPPDPIEAAFAKVYGLPCWGVKPGHGSFITLEFGEPHLEIREPREPARARSIKAKKALARRRVTPRGQWHLWIFCCYWNLFVNGQLIGDSKSDTGISKSVLELDGQKLLGISANYLTGRTAFDFDLGGRLTTRPFDLRHQEPSEQWLLFEPDGNVLTFRGDGMYSHGSKHTPLADEQWLPLK